MISSSNWWRTMRNGLVMTCPDWSHDAPSSRGGSSRSDAAVAYRNAMNCAGADQPITPEGCRDWHRTVFSSVVPVNYYAGNFRQSAPTIPCLAVDVEVGGLPGSHHATVIPDVERLCSDFNREWLALSREWHAYSASERSINAATVIGILIGRFVQIHPFLNGNGRISRIIWAFALRRAGVNPQVRIRLRPRGPAYGAAMAAAMKGDFREAQAMVLRHLARSPI